MHIDRAVLVRDMHTGVESVHIARSVLVKRNAPKAWKVHIARAVLVREMHPGHGKCTWLDLGTISLTLILQRVVK